MAAYQLLLLNFRPKDTECLQTWLVFVIQRLVEPDKKTHNLLLFTVVKFVCCREIYLFS
jgi:hypothetical protein